MLDVGCSEGFGVMSRVVLPELLDALPPQDAAAQRSRRDLRRLNAWMNHRNMMAAVLRKCLPAEAPRRIVELGAGDGHFLLSVAQRLLWRGTEAVLVDRLNALDPRIVESFRGLGWRVKAELAEAAEWLRLATPDSADAVISNLFFHQFETAALTELLRLAAKTRAGRHRAGTAPRVAAETERAMAVDDWLRAGHAP